MNSHIQTTRSAGIYVRISRDRAGAGLGVERQEQDCRALADQLGWAVVDFYSDNDISAYSGKRRPDYERMLADISAGRINAVIAWRTRPASSVATRAGKVRQRLREAPCPDAHGPGGSAGSSDTLGSHGCTPIGGGRPVRERTQG